MPTNGCKETSRLAQEAENTSLIINIQKTILLKVNNATQQRNVQLKGNDTEKDSKFTYLCNVVTNKRKKMSNSGLE